jgi:hypothetical protein
MPLQPRFVIADHTFTFIRVLVELPIARLNYINIKPRLIQLI